MEAIYFVIYGLKCENRTVWLSVKSLFVFVVVLLKNSVNFENIVVLCCMDYATIGHVHKPICFCNAEMFVKNSIENQLANPLAARVMNTEKTTISTKKNSENLIMKINQQIGQFLT